MEAHPMIQEILETNPLVIFSVYTDIQSRILRTLGREILEDMDAGIVPGDGADTGTVCDGEVIRRVYGKFWLRALGAYEVVRTMCQGERKADHAKKCFSPRLAGQLEGLKLRLEVLRMPFAKQELRGDKISVQAEPSICGIDASPADLRFEVKDQVISTRQLIVDFSMVFDSIARADVLADHRTRYQTKPGRPRKTEESTSR